LRYAAQATPIPKIRSCRGQGKAKSGSNTIFYGNAVDRTPAVASLAHRITMHPIQLIVPAFLDLLLGSLKTAAISVSVAVSSS